MLWWLLCPMLLVTTTNEPGLAGIVRGQRRTSLKTPSTKTTQNPWTTQSLGRKRAASGISKTSGSNQS